MAVAQSGTLERVVFDLIYHGRDRCGIGYGTYPLGIRHAISVLLPLCDQHLTSGGPRDETLRETVWAFDERLKK